ncbi:DEAD/DEAH box helicase family protein [archaeon]|nr:DEAD/DEAH box helicase family protein [archaeon]MCK9439403.1 DEAD/DEAH box helicase family protein [Patescibacteria group bacterium]
MWTYIEKEDVEEFIMKYPALAEGFDDISLYETENRIFVPRLFFKNFPYKIQIFESKETPIFQPTYFKFTGMLREEQVEIVKHVLSEYKQNLNQINGIIKARPGLGKTVLSVYLASKLGLKTCIIIDNENLLNQWLKSFLKFTDLTAEDIGLIKGKHFVVDRPVIIATVQTLLSKIKTDMHKNFQLIDKAQIGLVIYDETHNTSSSSKFARASLLFRTKNFIGLSATPFQTGIAEILMKNTIGEIIYETKRYDLKPTYILNHYDSKLSGKYSFILGKMSDYIKRKAFYNSIITKSPNYLKVILSLVKTRLKENHVVLILAFTKAQILLISDGLDKENIEHRRFYGDEKDELDKENVKVVVATYSYAGKGFDFEQLSSLILATNLAGKKSLIQVVGRILRDGGKDKKMPVVDDLIDMGFPSLFLPDVKAKKTVIKNEFNCAIKDNFIEII